MCTNNMIDNQSATLGSHAQWGIRLGANYNQSYNE